MTSRRLAPGALEQHIDALYRAAWALTGDRHEAEDLVQDTCANVLARPRFVRGSSDRAYLVRALNNQHTNRFRRRRRRPDEVALTDAQSDRRGPDDAYEVREIFAAIATLDPDRRAALVAVDVVGLSYAEAAAMLDVKEGTLTTRLHRARRSVAALLSAERVTQ